MISHFAETYRDDWREEFEHIISALEFLTEYYTRTRCPFLVKGEVISPVEFIDRDLAKKAIDLAERALEAVKSVLRVSNVV